MSRSFKKNPIISNCSTTAKSHKIAKKRMTNKTRIWLNNEEKVPSGSTFKKLIHDYQWRPDDGRKRLENYPKAYRK